MNLGDIPRRNARRFPDKTGIVFGDVRLTWRDVNDRVNRLVHAFRAHRLESGDRVAILAHNDHRYLEIYWALAKAGLIAVPLNYRLVERELVHLLKHAEARALVVGPEYAEASPTLRDAVPSLDWLIAFGGKWPFADDYDRLLEDQPTEEPEPGAEENDPFAILYTSGTTGLPKGAVVTHRNLEANALNQMVADKADPEDINLTATPLYHMGALFMVTTYTSLGCTHVILPTFDPGEVQRAIAREKATVCLLIPTMLNMVLHHEEFGRHDLSSLRLVFYGGSIMPLPVLRRAIETIGCSFTQGYGLTETIEATFLTAADHVLDGDPIRERRLASAGREAVNAEVRVVDEEGHDLGPGEVGEVLIRSHSVIREYWRAPDETRRAIKDGWFYTGDVGSRDEDGYLYIVDRKKDVIISGGTNIYPKEVEDVLYEHPAVLEAAVIGVPDPLWGESVKAVVVLKAGKEATEKELIELCRANLASYKKPNQVSGVRRQPTPKSEREDPQARAAVSLQQTIRFLSRAARWQNSPRKTSSGRGFRALSFTQAPGDDGIQTSCTCNHSTPFRAPDFGRKRAVVSLPFLAPSLSSHSS
jgi:acyl-CoA synthetase (AMP-forming)/AMP-acid ligase II